MMNQSLLTTPPPTSQPSLPSPAAAVDDVPIAKIVSDQALFYTTLVIQATSSGVSLFGIVANALNIAVFIRQGAKSDSTNASLLGLAVTDLAYLVSSLWLSVSQAIIIYAPPGLNWIPFELAYIFSGIPNYMFAQITKMATAFIAFQRCICVVFPFKVKSLFTSGRTCIVFVSFFVLTCVGYIPLLASVYRLGYKTDLPTNTTRFGVIGSPGYKTKVNAMLYANNVTFNVGSVVTVLACTIITVYQLNLSKVWRESNAKSSGGGGGGGGGKSPQQNKLQEPTTHSSSSSSPSPTPSDQNQPGSNNHQSSATKDAKMQKERKLVKVIVTISAIFMFTYLPNIGYLILTMVNPHARVMGKNHNLAQTVLAVNFLMETTNSSINIVVYYLLSSSYKEEIKLLLKSKSSKST